MLSNKSDKCAIKSPTISAVASTIMKIIQMDIGFTSVHHEHILLPQDMYAKLMSMLL